ncbi:MAG TPA: DNRLRE domain-containing protein [Cytophagaceae bacterium]|jgi:hypothetical protein|nr:DNRLRE domain-containing protein [Cytophagaceae bacterium]
MKFHTKQGALFVCAMMIFFHGCKQQKCPEPITFPSLPSQHQLKLKPTTDAQDAFVFSVLPTTNFGNNPTLQTMVATWSLQFGVKRSFINFDLSAIPTDAEIQSAVLTLFADTLNVGMNYIPYGHSTYGGDNTWVIDRVTSPWTENTITWNNQPSVDTVGQITMPASISRFETYTVDITHFVKNELIHPDLYYGIMFHLQEELIEYREIAFCPGDHQHADQLAPELYITYKK